MKNPLLQYVIGLGVSVGVLASCQNPGKSLKNSDNKNEPFPKDSLKQVTDNNPIDNLSRQITESPDNPTLYVKRARRFLQNNDLENAEKDVLRALEADSSFSDAYELLA
ncbi:MAG: hypothetical protein D6707_03760, partial [Bacteroidetes bacterium]